MTTTVDLPARFWAKVDKSGECWLWTRGTQNGYGKFQFEGSCRYAHRLAYEAAYGPIPGGLHLDHTCHNGDLTCKGGGACQHRRCVNPAHLEPVSSVENVARSHCRNAAKTHCPSGHEYTEANTYRHNGRRQCRTCVRAAISRWGKRQTPAQRQANRDREARRRARVRAAGRAA